MIEKVVDVELVRRTGHHSFSSIFDSLAVTNQSYQQTKATSH